MMMTVMMMKISEMTAGTATAAVGVPTSTALVTDFMALAVTI